MSDPAPDKDDRLASRALTIATALAAAGPGEKAAARRMGPEGAPVFWRHIAQLALYPSEERAWLQITRLIALMTPSTAATTIHTRARPLGAALAEARLSEQRLARLLAARGPARDDALERAIRLLARDGGGIDVISLARFALGRDGNATARTYYQQLDHTRSEAPTDV